MRTDALRLTLAGAIGAAVARFVHTEEVTGSNPGSPTLIRHPTNPLGRRRASSAPVLELRGFFGGIELRLGYRRQLFAVQSSQVFLPLDAAGDRVLL